MKDTAAESPAATCGYCGRANPDRLPACAGCGTPLVSAAPLSIDIKSKPKSKGVAVALAFIFGPIGLLYLRAWGPAFILMMIRIPFLVAHKGGLWLALAFRVVSAVWAYAEASEHDESAKPRHNAARMLDKAALLESVDRSKALAAYEQIVQLYPDTPAGIHAVRNIEILRRPVVNPENG